MLISRRSLFKIVKPFHLEPFVMFEPQIEENLVVKHFGEQAVEVIVTFASILAAGLYQLRRDFVKSLFVVGFQAAEEVFWIRNARPVTPF